MLGEGWRWRSQTTSPRRLLVVRPDGEILLHRLGSSPSVIGANLFVCGLVVKAEALILARLFPMKTRWRPIGETTSAVTASTLSISGLHGWRSIETQLRSPRMKLSELGFCSFRWSWASARGGLGLKYHTIDQRKINTGPPRNVAALSQSAACTDCHLLRRNEAPQKPFSEKISERFYMGKLRRMFGLTSPDLLLARRLSSHSSPPRTSEDRPRRWLYSG
ncbi:hypothetical protein DY000_02006060 [Brassica cretica]|uniref:Uncharacterized protein n=1 Tax=Brassica cretica TaxID=69181 RepID=A0ABQ7C513_BRACR|nr:hypothetical protein DY000_02006060 [Brassica cretica]